MVQNLKAVGTISSYNWLYLAMSFSLPVLNNDYGNGEGICNLVALLKSVKKFFNHQEGTVCTIKSPIAHILLMM